MIRELCALLLLVACTGSAPTDTDTGEPDTGDSGTEDSDSDSGDSDTDAPLWEVLYVDVDEWGFDPHLAAGRDGSLFGVSSSFFAVDNDLECDEGYLSYSFRWILEISLEGPLSATDRGTVQLPLGGGPTGLALAVGPDGTPWVAASQGESLDGFAYCGGHDLGLGQAGRPLAPRVTRSDEAPSGDATLDQGQRVGFRPTLAVSPSGTPAVVYEDRHSGVGEPDLELVLGQVGARTLLTREEALPDSRDLVYDADGRLFLRTGSRLRRLDGAGGEHTLSGTVLGLRAHPGGGIVAVSRDGSDTTVWRQRDEDLAVWTSESVPLVGTWPVFDVLSDGRLVFARPASHGLDLAWMDGDGVSVEQIAAVGHACDALDLAIVGDVPVVFASCPPPDWNGLDGILYVLRRTGSL